MKWRRYVLLGASIAIVAVLGAVASWTQTLAASRVSSVHKDDRVRQQATLAGLTGQYMQFTFLAANNAAQATRWSLEPNDAADRARLQRIVKSSPLTSYGAVLASLTGQPLTAYPSLSLLPKPTDPGFRPMRAELIAGQPGLSSVMHVGSTPLVAFAVPVRVHGTIAGLLVTFADVRSWPLQGYDAKLQMGKDARPYILDSAGVVAASSDVAALGKPLTGLPSVVRSGKTGITTFTDSHGVKRVVSYGPAGSGWTVLTVQSAHAFSGGLDASHQHEVIALLGLLTLAVLLLVVFHHKRQKLLARLADERLYDPLTGLAQRRLFELRLESAVARQKRSGRPMAMLFCDLDDFKSINDRLGHNAGDQVLVAVARALHEAVREEDMVARIGGDEFAVILEEMDPQRVELTAQRLRAAVASPVTVSGRTVTPAISVGGALLRDPERADELLHEADIAMYHAKRRGDGVCTGVVDVTTASDHVPMQRDGSVPTIT